MIARFISAMDGGNPAEAERILRVMLVNDPADAEALFQLARLKIQQNQAPEALDLLNEIPDHHPMLGINALGTAADLCMTLERFADAEAKYRRILALQPETALAKRQLAYLYNRQGRRHDANLHLRDLCAAGDILQEELNALVVQSDAVYLDPTIKPMDGSRPYWPIGPGGVARYQWTQSMYREAAASLRPLIDSDEANDADWALYGAALAESQQDQEFQNWLMTVPEGAKQYPEYWAAVGTQWVSGGDLQAAVGALGQALLLDPTDIRSTRRMNHAFRAMGDVKNEKLWEERFKTLVSSVDIRMEIMESKAASAAKIETLAARLDQLNRPVEAIAWRWLAAIQDAPTQDELRALNQRRIILVQERRHLPNAEHTLCGLDLSRYPVPTSKLSMKASPIIRGESYDHFIEHFPKEIRFENVSMTVGVNHSYHVDTEPRTFAFSIYETFGGGVAIHDFDLDGRPDVYLTQGHATWPDFIAQSSDQLFRNVPGQSLHFSPITSMAGIEELAFTTGATAGDWNQDGFPDLAIANVGPEILLINQGDGTFIRHVLNPDDTLTRLSTSLAIADLDGDHLPDLYVANYIDDPEINRKPKLDSSGRPVEPVNPVSFRPANDEYYLNDGLGGWSRHIMGSQETHASTSLGLLIADVIPPRGNECFIANDERNNQLWRKESVTSGWSEIAVATGCATGSLGAMQGSMGIAAADFDESGTLDLHVTNFYKESSNHYMNVGDYFRDLNVRYEIDRLSVGLVGFGCQAIDVNNRGVFDLAIANGHVENFDALEAPLRQPFRQPTQMLMNQGSRFESARVVDPSGYWSKNHLGRSLAKGDMDSDGRTDLFVTDLIEPVAVLLNQTPQSSHWVDLHLVGTVSERDAVGASILIEQSDRRWTQWVTAGDGYLCKNQAVIHQGLGANDAGIVVTVTWPSASVQRWELPKADRAYLLVEGEPRAEVIRGGVASVNP